MLVALSGCASDKWTKEDTQFEIAYQLVNAVDAYTTTQIHRTPGIIEVGWPTRQLLGPNPDPHEALLLHATYGLSHYIIAMSLPRKWRRYYQGGTTAFQTHAVINNCRNGLC